MIKNNFKSFLKNSFLKKNFNLKYLKKNRQKLYHFLFAFLLLFVSLVNLRAFFKPGIFQGHDSENHLARIANYYIAIKDGHIPPRWAKNLNHKFGYPVFNFNYPLANILSYPLIVLGFNIEASLKIILFSFYFASGLFFYLWIRNHFSNFASFLAGLLYMLAPYQFLDIYVRGVVGENLTLALFPAVLLFLNRCFKKKSKITFLGLVLTTSMFSLSHNLMVMVFSPLLLLYLLFLLKGGKRYDGGNVKTALFAFGLGYLLTSFFWIPALLEKQFVTLKAFDPAKFYKDHFIYLSQLFEPGWRFGFSVPGPEDTMSFQLGLFHWLAVFLSFFTFIYFLFFPRKKRGSKERTKAGFWGLDSRTVLVGAGFLLLGLFVFLMLEKSLILWQVIPFLGYMQFPWRFLGLVSFFVSLVFVFLADKYKTVGAVLVFSAFLYTQQFTVPFNWEDKSDMTYYDFLFTTSVLHENKPVWFSEENIHKFRSKFISENGLVSFNELKWKTNEHVYEIKVEKPTKVWEHTAYFPGWQVFVDGAKTKIDYNNKAYPGIIGFEVEEGKHQIKSVFTQQTTPRIVGNSLTILSFVLTAVFLIKKKSF